MMPRRDLLALAVLGACAGAAQAGEAPPPPAADIELLEFLGSLDTEDEEWREYLADRPIGPEAGKPATARRAPPTRKPASPAPEKTEDKVKQP